MMIKCVPECWNHAAIAFEFTVHVFASAKHSGLPS